MVEVITVEEGNVDVRHRRSARERSKIRETMDRLGMRFIRPCSAAPSRGGGRTAHARFKIPIDVQENITCCINSESDIADLIRAARVIIWDAAPMMHCHVFEAVDRTLKDICGCDRPFGGKVVVLGGDFRQCLPVIPKGTKTQIVEASLSRSPL